MTQVLVKHDEIRQWAVARSGNPAIEDRVSAIGGPLVLRIVFDQMALNAGENQYGDRIGGLDLVDWAEWFEEFDRLNYGLLVEDERPGVLDDYYEFVPRDGNQRD
ncbi:MAG: hypothetical protein ACO1OG_06985 [Devosia sp.]